MQQRNPEHCDIDVLFFFAMNILNYIYIGHYSQFLDDNDDGESQKFLANGMMKKKKYEEYNEEYVRTSL